MSALPIEPCCVALPAFGLVHTATDRCPTVDSVDHLQVCSEGWSMCVCPHQSNWRHEAIVPEVVPHICPFACLVHLTYSVNPAASVGICILLLSPAQNLLSAVYCASSLGCCIVSAYQHVCSKAICLQCHKGDGAIQDDEMFMMHSRQQVRRFTVSDYTNVNVCTKGVSTIMRCSHQDAAGSNKRVIHKVTLLDLQ